MLEDQSNEHLFLSYEFNTKKSRPSIVSCLGKYKLRITMAFRAAQLTGNIIGGLGTAM